MFLIRRMDQTDIKIAYAKLFILFQGQSVLYPKITEFTEFCTNPISLHAFHNGRGTRFTANKALVVNLGFRAVNSLLDGYLIFFLEISVISVNLVILLCRLTVTRG